MLVRKAPTRNAKGEMPSHANTTRCGKLLGQRRARLFLRWRALHPLPCSPRFMSFREFRKFFVSRTAMRSFSRASRGSIFNSTQIAFSVTICRLAVFAGWVAVSCFMIALLNRDDQINKIIDAGVSGEISGYSGADTKLSASGCSGSNRVRR